MGFKYANPLLLRLHNSLIVSLQMCLMFILLSHCDFSHLCVAATYLLTSQRIIFLQVPLAEKKGREVIRAVRAQVSQGDMWELRLPQLLCSYL